MSPIATPGEYQAAAALAAILRSLPPADVADYWPEGLVPVTYVDHIANTVHVTVNGEGFHAVVVRAL